MNEADRQAASRELTGAVNAIIGLVNGYPIKDRHKIATTAAVALVRSVMNSTPNATITFELLIMACVDALRDRMNDTETTPMVLS